MRLKRIFKGLVTALYAMLIAFGVSSCSNEDDVIYAYLYSPKGGVSASSSDALISMYAIADYTEAITNGLGNYYFNSEKDNEVISICDVVYQNHRTNHPTWKGVVEIEKSKIDSAGEILSSVVIKTYNYE